MSEVGGWNINVSIDSMPEKVATAVSELATSLVGAEYTPIAYLGEQTVNGTNHAVLAKQTILTGKDTTNIVVLIFNEKPSEMKLTLVSIECVIEGGIPEGGISINVATTIPEDAKKAFDSCLAQFVGSNVEAFALLGTQITKGTDYIFAATAKAVAPEAKTRAVLVRVSTLSNTVAFADLLATKHDVAVGHAFNL